MSNKFTETAGIILTPGVSGNASSKSEEHAVELNPHSVSSKAILALIFANARLVDSLAARGLITPDEVLAIWNVIRLSADEESFRQICDSSAMEFRALHKIYAHALRMAKDNIHVDP
jgi:hypothetical protein